MSDETGHAGNDARSRQSRPDVIRREPTIPPCSSSVIEACPIGSEARAAADRHERLLTDLRDRLEKAEKKILYLQQLLRGQGRNVYTGIRLTPNQETVVNRLLATNGICSKEQLYDALYLSREGLKPDPKILRETIRVVRKQLRSHGIEIKNEFGKGYTMPRESKAKLRKLAAPRGKQAGST
jgi:biotin operon repressor